MEAMELVRKAMKEASTRERLAFGCDDLLKMEMDNYNEASGVLEGMDCPYCKNKGRVAIIEDGYVLHKECKCMSRRRSIDRIKRSGLMNQLEKCTFDSYKAESEWQQSIKEKAKRFLADNHGKWFFIGGQVGSGKSHVCTAIVGEMLKMGHEAKYMLWLDDVTPLKAGIMEDDHAFNMNKFKKVKVLYIDDFFKSEVGKMPSQADIKIAFEILNHRYNNPNLITIISSEKTIKDLLDIDEAIGSRVYEKTKEYSVNIGRDKTKNFRMKE